MPVSSPLTPKSVLRHRPLDSNNATKERPTVIRASRPALSTKKIVPPPVACSPKKTLLAKKGASPIHLTSIGIGMIVAIVAVLLGQLLLGWLGTTWDDLHYGTPRTYQTDAFLSRLYTKLHRRPHILSCSICMGVLRLLNYKEVLQARPKST